VIKEKVMAKLERWGKPYGDTRDWREYNEQLVKRGTLYLSLEFVEQWDQLVGDLNRETGWRGLGIGLTEVGLLDGIEGIPSGLRVAWDGLPDS
jgi:hypothetical protein